MTATRVDAGAAPAVVRQRMPLPAGIWKVVSVAVVGSFMAQLDATVVNVSLSSLAADLHADLTTIQWTMSGYLLALALVLPLNGWLVDRIGARALCLWCYAAFTLSSVLCGLAWSAGSLIGFRLLQGMSGGLLAPMAQIIVARAAGAQLARVASMIGIPILLAPLLGPVVAGAILHFASWRWLFLINLPAGVLAFVLAARFLPQDRSEARPRSLDLLGLGLLSPGLVLFLYGADHVGEPIGGAALCVSVALFALFAWTARRKGDAALIDLRLLKDKAVSASVASMFMVNGVSFAGQFLIPIWLARACGQSPSRIGWLLLPLGLGLMTTYPLLGRLTDRFGMRKVAACGALLSLLGTLPFVALAHFGFVPILLAASLFLRGAGISAIGVPSTSSCYASVRQQDLPMAATTLNIGQRLGGPTWTTVCATFLGWQLAAGYGPAATSDAYVAAFGLLCALHAVLFLVTLRLPLRPPSRDTDGASA